MSVNQFIMLLCFYIIGLTGCNKIGNHSYMHSDACNDDIASLNKLDKLLEEIQNEQPEEIQNSDGSNDDIANLNKLDKLLEKIQNEQPEEIQNETSSIQPTRKQRKACAITSDLELKILNYRTKKTKMGMH